MPRKMNKTILFLQKKHMSSLRALREQISMDFSVGTISAIAINDWARCYILLTSIALISSSVSTIGFVFILLPRE